MNRVISLASGLSLALLAGFGSASPVRADFFDFLRSNGDKSKVAPPSNSVNRVESANCTGNGPCGEFNYANAEILKTSVNPACEIAADSSSSSGANWACEPIVSAYSRCSKTAALIRAALKVPSSKSYDSNCYAAVKDLLVKSGYLEEHFKTPGATGAIHAPEQLLNYGFEDMLSCPKYQSKIQADPCQAPAGSLLVYRFDHPPLVRGQKPYIEDAGHIEVKTAEGCPSFFSSGTRHLKPVSDSEVVDNKKAIKGSWVLTSVLIHPDCSD